jgi:hypothetical protein
MFGGPVPVSVLGARADLFKALGGGWAETSRGG